MIPSEWRAVVNFRNIIAHEYFGINYDEVFNIVKKHIPELEDDVLGFVKDLKNSNQLLIAVAVIIEELKLLNRKESIKYLQKVARLLKKS